MGSCISVGGHSSQKKKKKINETTHGNILEKSLSDILSKSKSHRWPRIEKDFLHRHALAMVLYHEQLGLNKSASVRFQGSQRSTGSLPKSSVLPRSASTRPRHADDPVLKPQQFCNKMQEASLNAETKEFLLVHGGGFGAWCWYKLIALLEESGFVASTVDLMGSGIDLIDANCVSDLKLYAKPLIQFLQGLSESTKVILVGHDVGGACISYAMELLPQKIAKAVFVCATMVTNGQRAFDVFTPEVVTGDDLLPKAQIFNYADRQMQSPTSIVFRKDLLKELLFNQSPAKDIALATLSMRPVPFGPVMETLSLTPQAYGSIPRFYIATMEDQALRVSVQENMLKLNPPDRVFRLKGSDHAPFFSRPQALYKMLVEISNIRSGTLKDE